MPDRTGDNSATRAHASRAVPAALAGLIALVGLGSAALVLPAAPPAFAAGDPCGPGGNKISCENSLPGTPASQWDISGSGSDEIQGFSTDISVNVGQRVDFKIDTVASSYTIDIYRSGYYQGLGARKVATTSPSASLPQHQPQCITEAATELYDCGNWTVSASWNVPASAVSGVYFAHLKVAATGAESHITFVVRDDSSQSDLVFQTADTSWQAYNDYGGSNFYHGGAKGRAYKLSYNRPVLTRDGIGGRDFYFANEYPLVRFLERNGYDVSYISGVDADRRGHLLTNHDTYLSVGHDEYWSGAQRANVEAARDAGVNLMFLSGNEVYWRTRYEPSADASRASYRTLVTYKETWANNKIDPVASEWTGTWRDPRYAATSTGAGIPENSLTGTMFQANHDDLAIEVSAVEGRNRLWRNTPLASLSAGSRATLAPHTIGYESNEAVDNDHRPPGLVELTATTGETSQYLVDYGNTVIPGTTTHSLTLYRAPSGALVFSAGTIQWTWGLDETHDSAYDPEPADPRMQQAQVNLLADMGAQPTTLMSGLTAATASTDTAGPAVSIASPAAASTQSNGSPVTLSGAATDSGGGVVAGVEVSLDGGASWHPARGRATWEYTYTQRGAGSTQIKVRAMDDSANQGAVVSRSFNVACPCSVFGQEEPPTKAVLDPSAVELGLRFSSTADGFVTGVRFYKGQGNTGTHTGSLWNSSGQRLASVTFTNESATGWQTAMFSSAVAVTAGADHVVSYTAPSGRYAAKESAFAAKPLEADPLYVDGGFGAPAAGVFGPAGAFPSSSFGNANYYVDVLFTGEDTSPLIGLNHSPLPDSTSVPPTTKVSAKFSKTLEPGTQGLSLRDAQGATVMGSVTYDAASRLVTFTPDASLAAFTTYTATLTGQDGQSNPVSAGKSWSFTTAKPPGAPGVCPCTLFDDGSTPGVPDAGERRSVTLGVRFASTKVGLITGLRFYKGPANTGSHVGTLWAANGTVLARGTFTDESSAGWQTLSFTQPVEIAINTEYYASYRSPGGSFSMTPNDFATTDRSRGPLRVSADSGAYSYPDQFPSARSSSNYLMDVVFELPEPVIAIESRVPGPGAVDVPRDTRVAVTFSDQIAPGTTLSLRSGGSAIAGSTTLSPDGRVLTFNPSALYPKDVDVSVSLSGVVSAAGASLAPSQWTFRTAAGTAAGLPESMFGGVSPVTNSADDSSPVELGTAFSPARDGEVTSIRFYKGPGNGGTHVGRLWTINGTLLSSVTFTGETAQGWQSATLSAPVRVSEGTTYLVSYHAPQGHYAVTANFFDASWTEGNLVAPSGANGRFLYGGGGFPTNSFRATNYFVDVVFRADPAAVTVTDRSPAPGSLEVPASTKPTTTFNTAIVPGYAMTVTRDGSPVAGTTALSTDARTITFTPSAPLTNGARHTVTVSGVESTAGATLAPQTWDFSTEAIPTYETSLLAGIEPLRPANDDRSAVELGMAFTPSAPGSVTALRFYKGSGNTGQHVGSLWTAAGARLATVEFTNESASGWQNASLSTPVPLTAGTTYVVSYYAPNGRYSSTPDFFASPFTSGPLTGAAGNNGRYRYGGGGGFPTNSYRSTNYFVDVVFKTGTG